MENVLEAVEVSAYFGSFEAVKKVSLTATRNKVLAIIGPSGCGKSTFLRCVNRLHEEVPGASIKGKIILEGRDVLNSSFDTVVLRREVGMVFQKPNPFPGLSIFDNVVAGLRLAGIKKKDVLEEAAEKALRGAALWEEVKDALKTPGTSLSGGQQQRLCIARALAVEPKILLMDEPTSALDPISTSRVEELVEELKKVTTIMIVTHNMQQASRISDQTAFFYRGDLIEHGDTTQIFENPNKTQTRDYVEGRFG